MTGLLASTAIGIRSCVGALELSCCTGSASGATIVLVATVAFFVLLAAGRLRALLPLPPLRATQSALWLA